MSRAKKSLLIAFAVIAVGIGGYFLQQFKQSSAVQQPAPPDPSAVAGENGEAPLHLERATMVGNNGVIRMDLVQRSGSPKFSSGDYYDESHNILFIPPDDTRAHWLLPNNNGHFADPVEIHSTTDEKSRVLASAIIVREKHSVRDSPGRLLLFDVTGEHVVDIDQSATVIDLASLTKSDIVLLYRRGSHFVRSTFDPVTLAKRTEREIEIPSLK